MRPRFAATLFASCLAGAGSLAQSPRSGLDVAGFDRSALPQDDLYAHVNGAWLKRVAIPDDRVTYSAFAEITDKTDLDLRRIIDETAALPNRPRGSAAQQIVDLYASVVNVARIEELGACAIALQVQRILAQHSFFTEFAALVPAVPLTTLRAWLLSRYVTAAAPYLNRAFDDAHYDFSARSSPARRGTSAASRSRSAPTSCRSRTAARR